MPFSTYHYIFTTMLKGWCTAEILLIKEVERFERWPFVRKRKKCCCLNNASTTLLSCVSNIIGPTICSSSSFQKYCSALLQRYSVEQWRSNKAVRGFWNNRTGKICIDRTSMYTNHYSWHACDIKYESIPSTPYLQYTNLSRYFNKSTLF